MHEPKIKYYNALPDLSGNGTLSVDNIRLSFYADSLSQELIDYFFNSLRIEIDVYPVNFVLARYQHLCTVRYSSTESMTIGFGFNGATRIDEMGRDNAYKGYCDFNPNKLASYSQFWADYRYLLSCCRLHEIDRCDIAYDISVPRENIILRKDNRVYECKAYSPANKTEYLGLRSHPGRVKIYNKAMELKIPGDLTRIEITMKPLTEQFFAFFPEVYNIACQPSFLYPEELSQTDIVLIQQEVTLLLNHLDDGMLLFNQLSDRKKQKLKPYIVPESCRLGLSVSFSTIDSLLLQMRREFL